MNRKRLIWVTTSCALFALCAPVVAVAADYVPLAPIPGLTETVDPTNTSNIATFFNAIYVFLIGIAVVLAVIMIIWGGFQYALSEAITSKSEGKRKIQQALFGLVLVLSPALVFTIINPAILNLSVNLQPLKTTWKNFTGVKVAPKLTGADLYDSYTGYSFFNCGSGIFNTAIGACSSASSACTKAGGTYLVGSAGTTRESQYACVGTDQKYTETTSPSCPSGETLALRCTPPSLK